MRDRPQRAAGGLASERELLRHTLWADAAFTERLTGAPAILAIPSFQRGDVSIRLLQNAQKDHGKEVVQTQIVQDHYAGVPLAYVPHTAVDKAMIAQVVDGDVRFIELSPRRIIRLIAGNSNDLAEFRRHLVLVRPCDHVVAAGQRRQELPGKILGDAAARRRQGRKPVDLQRNKFSTTVSQEILRSA